MSYYPKPDNHIRNKAKVVLYLLNCAAKKVLDQATSDLAGKKGFIALKSEGHQLDINKLVNVPTSLNHLKTKVDDLDVGELKTVPVDLKKLNDLIDNEIVKSKKLNTLKTQK